MSPSNSCNANADADSCKTIITPTLEVGVGSQQMLTVNILAITNGCLPYTTQSHGCGQPLAGLSMSGCLSRGMVLSTGLGENHWCDMPSKIPFR